MNVAVIIPALNEGDNIRALVAEALATIPSDIIAVDKARPMQRPAKRALPELP